MLFDEPRVLTFSEAIRSVCTNISIVDDDIVEGDEMFTVSLARSEEAVSFANQTATVTIEDSDQGV